MVDPHGASPAAAGEGAASDAAAAAAPADTAAPLPASSADAPAAATAADAPPAAPPADAPAAGAASAASDAPAAAVASDAAAAVASDAPAAAAAADAPAPGDPLQRAQGPPRSMAPLAAVGVPQKSAFAGTSADLYMHWLCDRVTSKGRRRRCVLIVTAQHAMLCEAKSGTLIRVADLAEIQELVVRCMAPGQKDQAHVMINMHPGTRDQSLQLYVLADAANVPAPADEHTFISVLEQARANWVKHLGGAVPPLMVQFIPESDSMWNHGVRAKPRGYRAPADKMHWWQQQRRQALWERGSRPQQAAEERSGQQPEPEPEPDPVMADLLRNARLPEAVLLEAELQSALQHRLADEWRNDLAAPNQPIIESPPPTPPPQPLPLQPLQPAPAADHPASAVLELRRLLCEVVRLRTAVLDGQCQPEASPPGGEVSPSSGPPPEGGAVYGSARSPSVRQSVRLSLPTAAPRAYYDAPLQSQSQPRACSDAAPLQSVRSQPRTYYSDAASLRQPACSDAAPSRAAVNPLPTAPPSQLCEHGALASLCGPCDWNRARRLYHGGDAPVERGVADAAAGRNVNVRLVVQLPAAATA